MPVKFWQTETIVRFWFFISYLITTVSVFLTGKCFHQIVNLVVIRTFSGGKKPCYLLVVFCAISALAWPLHGSAEKKNPSLRKMLTLKIRFDAMILQEGEYLRFKRQTRVRVHSRSQFQVGHPNYSTNPDQKSNNLHYNTLGCWVDGPNDS